MKDKVIRQLNKAGLPYRLIDHVAVHRVGEEPVELAGLPTTKNLLLKDRSSGKVYMIVMTGEKRLDLAMLAIALGTTKNRLQFVKYEDVEIAVGVQPGHVSVFNVLNEEAKDVRLVFEAALLRMQEIGFHPNVNTATVVMKPKDVITFLKLQGYTPLILDF